MIKIITHGNRSEHAIYVRQCCVCGCQFEYKKGDIDSSFFDQKSGCMCWYIACPECGDKTPFAEPRPIRSDRE